MGGCLSLSWGPGRDGHFFAGREDLGVVGEKDCCMVGGENHDLEVGSTESFWTSRVWWVVSLKTGRFWWVVSL